ncbi:plasmid replication initiator RepA [Aeromonas rivipollensis]|uniref:plasmid replication initiator RepA n=1 Tax=Aeromonas rivipollensis TaxID=948519 RepID=UPI00373AE985
MLNLTDYVHQDTSRPAIVRGCYVANATPQFEKPGHHKGRPQFIGKAWNMAAKRDLACWPGFIPLRPLIGRSRHWNAHRAKALNQMALAMLHYTNVITWQVETSVDVLTRQCGLDTTSRAGNHSISRGSRLIQDLEKMGILDCSRYWDSASGSWFYKSITVTERFWDMVGVGADEAIKARELAWEKWRTEDAWMKDGLDPTYALNLSHKAYCQLRLDRLKQRAFEYRHNKSATAAQIRRAKRLVAAGKDAMRREVADDMFKKLSPEDARRSMQDPSAFNSAVSLAVYRLEVLAMEPLPPE